MTQIKDVTSPVKGKNAGPFKLTFDIMFDSEDEYRIARNSRKITEAAIADVYSSPESDVVGIYSFDPTNSIKVTIRREIPSGHPADPDVSGS